MEPKVNNQAENNTAIKKWEEKNPLERRNTLEETLKRNSEQMAMVLPNHFTVGKLIGTVMMAIVRNPKILECTQVSILGAIWEAAQIGLSPNGLLGEGSLVPYNNSKKINGQWVKVMECQFLPEYRGFIKLAYKSPLVKTIEAEVVYEKDEFRYNKGLHPDLYHVPILEPDRGEITYAYCVVHLHNGGFLFDVMSRNQIDTIRLCSQNANGPAWSKWFAEMAKKSVIRRQFKTTPISEDASKAVSLSERAEILNQPQRNELELINKTVFTEVIEQEIDPSEIYDADYEETNQDEEPPPVKTKAESAMDEAVQHVKKNGNGGKNGNGNGNGNGGQVKAAVTADVPKEIAGKKPAVEMDDEEKYIETQRCINDIELFAGLLAEQRNKKEKDKADKTELTLAAYKLRYRQLTGKGYGE